MRRTLLIMVLTTFTIAATPSVNAQPRTDTAPMCESERAPCPKPLEHLRHLIQTLRSIPPICFHAGAVGEAAIAIAQANESEDTEEQLEQLEELEEECAELEEEVREAVEEAVEEACEAIEECREESEPHGSIFTVQMLYLDKEVLAHLRDFSGVDWDEPLTSWDRVTPMLGGIRYHPLPGGIRLGSGVWCGYNALHSGVYTTQSVNPLTDDTVTTKVETTLRIIPAFAGGVFEKTFQVGPVGFFGGVMIGGGVIVAFKSTAPGDDIFAGGGPEEWDGTWEHGSEDASVAVAPQIVGDLHAGVTARVAPSFSIGLDGQLLLGYAPGGFVTGSALNELYSVSPGIRLRFQWEKP